ncbi:MAG: 30S ribosome-binding factor RbfA [Clostridiales Family XIII bacterium]|jgi:phosphoesterase RecJ-like protein|nr:30S ribosome-binding factor RbfA [Clostridiales Family XIII bacterium]
MRKNHRGERLGEEIRKIVSELVVRGELKYASPGDMLSVTHVKAADDGSFATVYYTSLNHDADSSLLAFEKAKGFIRTEVAGKLRLRHAPELRFKRDEALEYGMKIDRLLDTLDIRKDEEVPVGDTVDYNAMFEIIDDHELIFAVPHIRVDGDTLGSAVALALTLRELGKEVYVVIDEEIPRNLRIVDTRVCITSEKADMIISEKPEYLAVAVDYAEKTRTEGREKYFDGAKATVCFDHHATSSPVCDFNIIEADSGSTAEVVFHFIEANDLPFTEEIAVALYVGIVTDTGKFQYSSVTAETHRIAGALIGLGADVAEINNCVYDNVAMGQILLERSLLDSLEFEAEGKIAVGIVTRADFEKTGAGDSDTEGLVEKLRSIEGVEVAVFLRETKDGKVKASLRSKGSFDVSSLSAGYGGGGHERAAGFTVDEGIESIRSKLVAEVKAGLG